MHIIYRHKCTLYTPHAHEGGKQWCHPSAAVQREQGRGRSVAAPAALAPIRV